MNEGWIQMGAASVLAIIGWFINDKLKSIKDDTGSVRSAVDAHERRITRVEKKQEKVEGILIGKGCLDSNGYQCLSEEDSQPPPVPPAVGHRHHSRVA